MIVITQSLREKPCKVYCYKSLILFMKNIISLEGRLWQIKYVYPINPKVTTEITQKTVIANKPTNEIKWNHKKV